MAQQFIEKRLQQYDLHPDAWGPIIIRDPQSTKERIAAVASDRYSYRQLDDFTDLIQRTLQRVPEVAKVQRVGVLPEQFYLEYSDARLAAFKLQPTKIKDILSARNVTAPGGIVETQSRNVLVDATAEFKSTKDIGNVLVGASSDRSAGLFARSRGHLAWISDTHTVPELHGLSRGERQLAPQPCHHPGRANAIGGTDRQIRRRGGQGACHRATNAAS